MINKAYEQAMEISSNKTREQTTEQPTHEDDEPCDEHILKYTPRPEEDKLYTELSKYDRARYEPDLSPILFRSTEIFVSAYEIARSLLMNRSLNTNAIHMGTCVLSNDPKQKRKKIMSPWV
uniref:Uncharacterized protein n=1 Tax=Setaria viridis TaxID=4556 RepID=A0A4U6UM16_SETVI|nr:hypothetical protein SEVIR_5G201232v2 [Setaria viridis]